MKFGTQPNKDMLILSQRENELGVWGTLPSEASSF